MFDMVIARMKIEAEQKSQFNLKDFGAVCAALKANAHIYQLHSAAFVAEWFIRWKSLINNLAMNNGRDYSLAFKEHVESLLQLNTKLKKTKKSSNLCEEQWVK
jgi:hypothetical protein